MSSKYTLALVAAGACAAYAAVVSAQPPAPPAPPAPSGDTLFFVRNMAPLPALGGRIDIIRGVGDVAGPVVKGKPYSARSITESTQTLADGNRITQRNESTIHRDAEGRTRREQTFGGVGPWQAGEPVTMINIHDPVADRSYVLDPVARTAREIKPFRMAIAHAQEGLEAASTELRATWNAPAPPPVPGGVTIVRRIEGNEGVQVFAGGAAVGVPPVAAAELGAYEPAEDLGEQVLEGLLVKGTRLIDTIPAGAMGNERSIEIVTERWYSEDIDAMVLQRFFDPRFGETIYRLVNVARGEPSPDLFQIPQGYTLETVEAPETGIRTLQTAPGQRLDFQFQRAAPADPQ